jgi:acyl carrier protein
MTLVRWVQTNGGVRRAPNALGYTYRISDPAAWNGWLAGVAGHSAPDLEVAHRTLRVRDQRSAAQAGQTAQQLRAVTALTDEKHEPPIPLQKLESKPALVPLVSTSAAKAEAARIESVPLPKSGAADDPVKQRVLALVAEKTGYPIDMLDIDLDLEADLGVDTVKQAEVFAAIREAYALPREDKFKLRDFPTLAHVIGFVHERRPESRAEKPAVAAAQPKRELAGLETAPTAPKSMDDDVKGRILALVVEKTGYPKDMLDLELDLEADLGIDTVKQAEMFAAIREIYKIPRDENRKLRDYPTLAHVIRFVYDKRPDLAGEAASAAVTLVLAAPSLVPLGRPAIPKTCWTWTWTWRPIWALIRSSKLRCSRRCGRPTAFHATRISNCVISQPWPASSSSPVIGRAGGSKQKVQRLRQKHNRKSESRKKVRQG